MKPKEVTTLFHITNKTLNRWSKSGILNPVKLGNGRHVYNRDEVMKLFRKKNPSLYPSVRIEKLNKNKFFDNGYDSIINKIDKINDCIVINEDDWSIKIKEYQEILPGSYEADFFEWLNLKNIEMKSFERSAYCAIRKIIEIDTERQLKGLQSTVNRYDINFPFGKPVVYGLEKHHFKDIYLISHFHFEYGERPIRILGIYYNNVIAELS